MLKRVLPKSDFVILLFIFIAQLIVLWPSFKLSLFGDDWMVFWRYNRMLVENAYGQNFTHLTYFLTPYGPMDINFGLLQKIFGYTPQLYFYTAFIYRYIMVAVFYFAVSKLTLNRWAGFAGSLFLAVTPEGLDTTNWVFNMTSYLGFALGIYFLYLYINADFSTSKMRLISSFLFLLLALITVPVRAHGFLPLLIFAEAVRVCIKRSRANFKEAVIRLGMLFVTVYLVKTIGTSFANPAESISRISTGLNYIATEVQSGENFGILLYPFANLGSLILPDKYLAPLNDFIRLPFLGRGRPFTLFSLSSFGIYALLLSLILKSKSGDIKTFYVKFGVFSLLGVVITYCTWWIYKANPVSFGSFHLWGRTLTGGYSVLFGLAFALASEVDKRVRNEKLMRFIAVFWPIAFLLLPWLSNPYSIFETTHRYMVGSAVGIGLFMSLFMVSKAFYKNRAVFSLLIILIFCLHAKAANSYLNFLVSIRGVPIANKIWSYVDARLPIKTDEFYAVAFIADTTNGMVVHNNAFFGFPPRMSLRGGYLIDLEMPIATMGTEELTNFVTTGERLAAHGKEAKPLPLDKFYAFEITGSNYDDVVITDRTLELRDHFVEMLKSDSKKP